jgi:hypothetical protein
VNGRKVALAGFVAAKWSMPFCVFAFPYNFNALAILLNAQAVILFPESRIPPPVRPKTWPPFLAFSASFDTPPQLVAPGGEASKTSTVTPYLNFENIVVFGTAILR